jgi:hypothetical protein
MILLREGMLRIHPEAIIRYPLAVDY